MLWLPHKCTAHDAAAIMFSSSSCSIRARCRLSNETGMYIMLNIHCTHMQYAKAKEAEGKHGEAADAYERGGDADAAVRLLISRLDNPTRAFALARRAGSRAAAELLVQHCMATSNWAGAVEFLMHAGEDAEALQVAQTHAAMDTYAACLSKDAPAAVRTKVAMYFQNQGEHNKAAAQHELAGSLTSCVSQLLAHAKKVRSSLCWLLRFAS